MHEEETEETRALFERFSQRAWKFSRTVFPSPATQEETARTVEVNLGLTRAVFGKWSPEIVVTLYTARKLGFEQLRKGLMPISRRVLSRKLKALEEAGIVARRVQSRKPVRVEYSLTEKGLLTARLAEPFFLFLRSELRDGRDKKGAGRTGGSTGA